MNRRTHAGFCTFDERNAGGRYQAQAELRRFKHVLTHTPAVVDCGEKGGYSALFDNHGRIALTSVGLLKLQLMSSKGRARCK